MPPLAVLAAAAPQAWVDGLSGWAQATWLPAERVQWRRKVGFLRNGEVADVGKAALKLKKKLKLYGEKYQSLGSRTLDLDPSKKW